MSRTELLLREAKATMNRRVFLEQNFTRAIGAIAFAAGFDRNSKGIAFNSGTSGEKKTMVVDSHQHFWDPVALPLPPFPPEQSVLSRAFLPADLRKEIREVGVNRTVLVQGYPQNPETNRWYFSQANTTDFVCGVVAWIDLQDPASAGRALEELVKEPKFVGIRHIVEAEPDINWMLQRPVLEGFNLLARRDVPFDMLVKPKHLENVLKVLDRVPDLPMVIDHIAKPNIAAGGSTGWAEHMAEIAKYPRVYCKLSGMVTEADLRKWKASDLTPYVAHVVKVFGWERVMFGSDWPVCLLAASYQQVWQAIHDALGEISDEHRNKIFGANAIRFYRLKV
jgi:L-fuconolactonase